VRTGDQDRRTQTDRGAAGDRGRADGRCRAGIASYLLCSARLLAGVGWRPGAAVLDCWPARPPGIWRGRAGRPEPWTAVGRWQGGPAGWGRRGGSAVAPRLAPRWLSRVTAGRRPASGEATTEHGSGGCGCCGGGAEWLALPRWTAAGHWQGGPAGWGRRGGSAAAGWLLGRARGRAARLTRERRPSGGKGAESRTQRRLRSAARGLDRERQAMGQNFMGRGKY